ncbi:hypothetical protein IQA64_18755, partial [Leptospira borgpetersenii serovar Tarassovi]|nr:hypothetical protein [Leptospira borgpetersenii serovar Tarassovi]
AYKLGLVAAGKTALLIFLKTKKDWDICAGNAPVKSPGGSALGIRSGKPYKVQKGGGRGGGPVSFKQLPAHATCADPVCRLLLAKTNPLYLINSSFL